MGRSYHLSAKGNTDVSIVMSYYFWWLSWHTWLLPFKDSLVHILTVKVSMLQRVLSVSIG